MIITRRAFLRHSAILAAAPAFVLTPSCAFAADAASAKVKVGVFGTAHSHASAKVATLRRMAELFDVVGVVEPDDHRRASLAKHPAYAELPVMTEEQLLNIPGLQAVLVECPLPEILPAATRLAAAGVHLHLEKPCGTSLPAFRALVDLQKAKSRIIQTGYMLRRNPAFEFCFDAVRQGWLGEIYEISAVMGKVVGPAERKSLAQFSGGMMFELGCHLIDAMVRMMGAPQQVHAYLRRTQPEQDDLADDTLAVCEYPKALATIRSAAIDVEGNARRSLVLCGDRGAATILPLESPKLTLTLSKPEGVYKQGSQPVELRKMPGRFDDQLADFARIIRGEKELDYAAGHDLAVLETVLRASGMATE